MRILKYFLNNKFEKYICVSTFIRKYQLFYLVLKTYRINNIMVEYRNKFKDVLFIIINKRKRTKRDKYSEIINRIETILFNEVVKKCVENDITNPNSQEFIEVYNDITYNELSKIRNKTFDEGTNKLTIDFSEPKYTPLKDKQAAHDNLLENPMKVEEGIFTCRKCSSNKTYSYAKQTRGADEPMTNFITCYKCGKKWTE